MPSALGKGTVTILVKSVDGSIIDAIDLTILAVKIDSVKIINENLSLYEMEIPILRLKYRQIIRQTKKSTWTSSDEFVATVDNEVLVTANKAAVVDNTVSNEDESVGDAVSSEVIKTTITSYQDLNYTITKFDEFILPK